MREDFKEYSVILIEYLDDERCFSLRNKFFLCKSWKWVWSQAYWVHFLIPRRTFAEVPLFEGKGTARGLDSRKKRLNLASRPNEFMRII